GGACAVLEAAVSVAALAIPVSIPIPVAVAIAIAIALLLVRTGDDEAEDLRRHRRELTRQPVEHGAADELQPRGDEDAVHLRAERGRVTDREHGRRVDQDDVRALPQSLQDVVQSLRSDELARIGRNGPRGKNLEQAPELSVLLPAVAARVRRSS